MGCLTLRPITTRRGRAAAAGAWCQDTAVACRELPRMRMGALCARTCGPRRRCRRHGRPSHDAAA
eukprot:4454203-Alexandrium_andersonii.AAC.1